MGRAWGMLSSGIAAAAALIGRGVIGGSLNFDGTRRYGPRVTATKNIGRSYTRRRGRGYKHSGERERLRHLRQMAKAYYNSQLVPYPYGNPFLIGAEAAGYPNVSKVAA